MLSYRQPVVNTKEKDREKKRLGFHQEIPTMLWWPRDLPAPFDLLGPLSDRSWPASIHPLPPCPAILRKAMRCPAVNVGPRSLCPVVFNERRENFFITRQATILFHTTTLHSQFDLQARSRRLARQRGCKQRRHRTGHLRRHTEVEGEELAFRGQHHT